MNKIVFQMEPLTCPSCIKKIEHALGKQPGVVSATVLFHAGKVRVEYDATEIDGQQIQRIIENLGYPVLSKKSA